MQIVFVRFYSILPYISSSYVKRCTNLLAHNILPYNVSHVSDQEITFYSQDKTVFCEMLSNKTTEQLVAMLNVIFQYNLSHLSERNSSQMI